MDLRSPAKKKRFQVVARNRMTSASGFTWFAREPKLIVGAEGRASSQRSIDYHIPSRPSNGKSGKRISTLTGGFFAGRPDPALPALDPVI